VIQQSIAAEKYKTTVSQPIKVGSPMPGDQLNEFIVHIPSVAELGADGDPFMLHIYAALAESRWYLSTRHIGLFGRFWRARHPPRYAAFNVVTQIPA
jgi:hypothetical protein